MYYLAIRTMPISSSPSVWPARLDLLQSASGLVLALFMWLHMAFVSSILLGNDAFWVVARFFEGYFILGRAYPGLVSLFVAGVLALIVLHAALALRKFPADWRQYQAFWRHSRRTALAPLSTAPLRRGSAWWGRPLSPGSEVGLVRGP